MQIAYFLSKLAYSVDSWWRKVEWAVNRSYGGILERWGLVNLEGHPPIAVWPLLALLPFLVCGPTLGLRGVRGVLVLAGSYLVVLVSCFQRRIRVLWVQCGLVWILVAFLFVGPLLIGSSALEASRTLYPHVLLPAVGILLALVSVAAPLIADRLLRRFRALYSDRMNRGYGLYTLLSQVDLFVAVAPPSLPLGRILRNIFSVPLYEPLKLTFPAALCTVALVDPSGARPTLAWTLLIVGVTWVFLGLAGTHQRLDIILRSYRRAFLVGGQLVVSLGVIGLAIAWWAHFDYLSTLMESAPRLVLEYITAAYLTFWCYEYWTNRVLCERLLGLLTRNVERCASRIEYCTDPAKVTTRVKANNRVVQIQGGARFVTVGKSLEGDEDRWQFYERMDLFDQLVVKALPETSVNDRESIYALGDLRQAGEAYFAFLNVVAIGIFMTILSYLQGFPFPPLYWEGVAKAPVVTAKNVQGTQNLTKLIFAAASKDYRSRAGIKLPSKRRVILLAASGGGTRAALYTSSLLEGLSRLGVLQDVVLASGVSGGGAALAYFACHRRELLGTGNSTAWSRFHATMADPFIQDVLSGAAEARVSAGTPLGQLLAESFERRFACSEGTTVGEIDIGLIFNATLVGKFPAEVERLPRPAKWSERSKSSVSIGHPAGGRLVFTNFDATEVFPHEGFADARHESLPYVMVSDPSVSLFKAAAISANFPPVFPDAAVDLPDTAERYWVTDGGAEENLGVISLLYALRYALREEISNGGGKAAPLPEIDIIVADASAESIDYHHDRGAAGVFGASHKLASQLAIEIFAQNRSLYHHLSAGAVPAENLSKTERSGGREDREDRSDLHVYYLGMPSILRTRAGLGTHWMLPKTVRFVNTAEADEHTAPSVTLSAATVMKIIRDLHRIDGQQSLPPGDEEANVNLLWKWIWNDRLVQHRQVWEQVRKELVHG